ncbi:TPA: nicotinamide-nucleotide amidohydrolase family protein [Thermoplasmata archaeon]|nr:nicotinamide-nucleotide amidohydrolase family protein [Thermoplasmata archaeon]
MLADELGQAFASSGLTLAVAESCTGGRLGDAVTNVPGSSSYFLGGIVSYSNDAKERLLDVETAVLESKGAVSEEVALMMADGVRLRFDADIGVGVTGIAGPSGETPGKPVGLVFIAVCSSDRRVCTRNQFSGSRSDVKSGAVETALKMLLDFLGHGHRTRMC